ncbi:MAG: hypothetical protein IVW51_06625 [Thermaceae bacterium]|nr:hypothetical protein [Thermaceae bacterium]
MENKNHIHTTVRFGLKTLVSRKAGRWLVLALLLMSAFSVPAGQSIHSFPGFFADGDGPKVGAGG